MRPVLFTFGGISVYSFGLMMGISFIIGSMLLTKELQRKKINPDYGSTITLIALLAGIAGSKILYLVENWRLFIMDPIGMAFSPGGLTFYGGFILATVSIYIYSKKVKVKFIDIADAISPALLLAYGIARIGCHLAGDGDYGFPTKLPWGTDYSNGTYPPSLAFKNFPDIRSQFPNGIVPDNTLCHPTPIYEFLLCAILFYFLWRNREKLAGEGEMFSLYLILAGLERFVIEFVRINDRFFYGLSEAQLISIVLIIAGAIGWRWTRTTPSLKS